MTIRFAESVGSHVIQIPLQGRGTHINHVEFSLSHSFTQETWLYSRFRNPNTTKSATIRLSRRLLKYFLPQESCEPCCIRRGINNGHTASVISERLDGMFSTLGRAVLLQECRLMNMLPPSGMQGHAPVSG